MGFASVVLSAIVAWPAPGEDRANGVDAPTASSAPVAAPAIGVSADAQETTTGGPSPLLGRWSLHGQMTYQVQTHGTFPSPYQGTNSFQDREETRASFTATFFAGCRLWRGAEAYANVEFLAGSGLSQVRGLAGPPNGETYRVDSTELKMNLARLYLRQTWNQGASTEAVDDDENQVAGRRSRRRWVLTIGKLSGTDLFDGSLYAHDPRSQFNNWSLWADAAWDYPADTRGYTWGLVAEWCRDDWSVRFGSFMVPLEANGMRFDHDVRHAHGEVLELEHDHRIRGREGAIRLLTFQNHARMGTYREALELDPAAPDVTSTRAPGRRKYGFGLNVEQALTSGVGMFMRAGWNDGRTESWAFTEVERTLTLGVSVSGRAWNRGKDGLGLALGYNGINGDHRSYLSGGGYGFMLGDGKLSYSGEGLLDAYYSFAIGSICEISPEVQRFHNLGFNEDRGPVTVYGLRVHLHY